MRKLILFAALALLTSGLAEARNWGRGRGYYGGRGYYYNRPPAVRVEYRSYSPGPGFAWVGGYWGAGPSAYYWNPGRWVRPPRPRAVWVSPVWYRDYNNRWCSRPGYWR